MTDHRYPFSAIVGQEPVKKALIYNLIEPRIGGVLLCGEKGTAKSTIVRGLAALGQMEVVDLPLNITEDMLVGSIDFEKAVQDGVRSFSGGLLQRANGNILYVDEVNLLPDGIINTLICSAASRENLVEREGISCRHESRFVLVGTMNPEEGKLRPQFLDRFGLYADVAGEQDIEIRAEIIRRRMEYERDPEAFCRKWQDKTDKLAQRIRHARSLVRDVRPDDTVRALACRYALQADTEGNRCELVLTLTAGAVAAWNGRTYITAADIQEAALYVLPHRRRQDPPPQEEQPPQQEPQDPDEQPDSQESQEQSPTPPPPLEQEDGCDGPEIDIPPLPEPPQKGEQTSDDRQAPDDEVVQGTEIRLISALPATPRDRLLRKGSGRRSKTKSGTDKGRYAGFTQTPSAHTQDLALDATLRAAAPYQAHRDHSECAVALQDSDLRFKIRENHVGATIVFVVDASGSMGAKKRMKATKEVILSMLMDSYQKRDRIGLVTFRKNKAETLLDITNSVDLAEKKLQAMPTGGRTPLAAGLYQAWQLLRARRLKDPEMLPMIVLVTDGRANQAVWSGDAVEDAVKAAQLIWSEHIPSLVIDTEKEFISLHIAQKVAAAMHADYHKVDELHSEQLRSLVKSVPFRKAEEL